MRVVMSHNEIQPSRCHRVATRDAVIQVVEGGVAGAPTLMFSNSLGTDTSMWGAQVAYFAKSFHVIRYDNRGHGGSSAPDGPYRLEDLALDAIAAMDFLECRRVHWCGLSLGGMVGQWLAANAPERISALVLANTGEYFAGANFWSERISAALERGMQPLAGPTLTRWLSKEFVASRPELVAPLQQAFLAVSPEGYAGCCAAIRDADLRMSNAGIKKKCLLIAGDKDVATPISMMKELQARIAHSELEVLNSGHLSNIEQPDRFNAIVGNFLSNILALQ
jgi:3-oxoadipate enol-lactonase